MGTLLDAETRRLYSWWWDNHVSPKNSKWLQENLTDMDAKIKSMIKLIEEDGDSFARRAEMYYKKRPELIKLVEEFYRAYHALAGRYDHATGALRHAHRTMAEAFPNQVSSVLTDDSLTGFSFEERPPTIDMPHTLRPLFDPDDLHKDAFGLSSSQFHGITRIGANSDESDFMMSRKGLKQLHELLDSGESTQHHVQFAPYHVKYETQNELKDHPNMVEHTKPSLQDNFAERNLMSQHALERLPDSDSQVSHVQEAVREHNKQARKSETEAQNLKQALARLEAEREANRLQYSKCLEMIHDLETKMSNAEDESGLLCERAGRAETEVQLMRQSIAKLGEEKEGIAFQYQQSLETISSLENEVSQAQEEARRLSSVVVMAVAKLNSAEEQYLMLERHNQSLQNEIDTLVQSMAIQTQELLEKHEEVQRLRIGVQEEHMRLMQTQAALRALQNLHSESQEDQRALALQNQNEVQMLEEMELRCEGLEEDIQNVKEENNSLKDQNFSFSILIKNLDDEVLSLREMKMKLEEEVEVHVYQRNTLQRDIYHLKEELDELNRRHLGVIQQVESMGLKPDSLELSLKNLQEENLKLKGICQKKNEDEEMALLEKSKNMEKLLEMDVLLENFLSHVNSKLERLEEKIKALEETCGILQGEKLNLVSKKDVLASQLEIASENVKKLSEKNTLLENSLFNAKVKLDSLGEKSKRAEESCQSLQNEKYGLLRERGSLISELESIQQRLEDMKKKQSVLEKEKDLKVHEVEELQVSYDLEKQELANFIQLSEIQLARLDGEIHILQEECHGSKKAFEEEQDKAAKLELEAFILQQCMQDIGKKNLSLSNECQKHFEASKLFENLMCRMEQESLEQRTEIKSLLNQVEKMRLGMHQLSKLLNIDPDYECQDKVEDDEMLLQHFIWKIEEMGTSSLKSEDEKLQLLLEKSILITLLGKLRVEAADLESQNRALHEVIEDHKAREDSLFSELQRKGNEVKIWENETMKLFGDCQVTSIRELLFEKKVHELIKVCEFLEIERTAKMIDNEQLKEIKHDLECENEEMKSKFAAYLPLIVSLRDKVTSFESDLLSQKKIRDDDNQEKEVDELATHLLDKSYEKQSEDMCPTDADGVSSLQHLHTRIEAIEKAVFEMKRLMMQKTVDTKGKLEAAMEQIRGLTSKGGSIHEKSVTASRDIVVQLKEEEISDELTELKLNKAEPVASNMTDGIFVKDIPLDQVSNCSSYDRGFDLCMMSRIGVDEPSLELWGDAQQGCDPDLAHHETQKPADEYSPSGVQDEKEVSIDKLEVSKGVIKANPEGNKRILDILGSDAQKLMSLEATFLYLKKKAEQHEQRKKGKNVDYGNIKWQLKEIEEAIKQLSDVNAILMKNAKAELLSSDIRTAVELREGRMVRRRSISEQAQRWSEKIGQVQLDLKNVQFLLLKLDDNENKGNGTRVSDQRVLLRDYLYGNRQRVHRKKKAMFFACVVPSDQSD